MSKNPASQPAIRPQPVPGYPQSPQKDRQKMGNPANANHLMKILADVMKSIITENGNFVVDNQLDCQNDGDFKDERQQMVSRNRNYQVVVITNKASIEKSKFGQKYRQSLDARDQMLSHPFQFVLQISAPANGSNSFMDTQAYQTLCQNIEEYIVDVVENVVSVSFNFLIEGKLKQNESKDFASKNILLNVYSVFKESLKTLSSEGIIYKKQNKRLRFALIQLVENCLNQVLVNLSSYYPQAPPSGGTPRMRQALLSIDRNYNQQLDFLYTQNLKITREDSGDYTEFIMKVINRAIQVTGEIDPKDPLQQTLSQKFVAFSEHLFWVTQEDSYNSVIQRMGKNATLDQNDNKSMRSQSEMSLMNKAAQEEQQLQNRQVPESPGFFNFFGKNTEPNKQDQNRTNIKIKTTNRGQQKKQGTGPRHQKQLISAFMRKPIFAEYSNASLINETNKQKKIEEMKKRHDFAMGQKIPGSVKAFSKKDLMDKNFSAKHSAVLRMLTKWAENLENIFQNPEAYTTNRIYPFKTLNHEIIYPKKQLKDILFKQITEKIPQKQKIKDYLIARNKVFQSAFFAKDNNKDILQFIRRYTETRVMASKMNALLIQFMKQYVSQLINLLVDAGKTSLASQQGQFTIQKESQINLVVFKIGDLMRSKIHCGETTFIRLLKTLYILEETNTLKNQNPVFELVRIKNKLDSRDNNILINYLFMGKIQCELQMSVQNMSGKELNYYSFAHFLYELTRGKFGVLAECATIIAQHDPIVSSSSSDLYYEPKKGTKRIKAPKKASKQQKPSQSQLKQGKQLRLSALTAKKSEKQKVTKEPQINYKQTAREEKSDSNKMFVCKKCDNLKFQENMDLLKREDKEQSICNRCLIANLNTGTTQKQEYAAENLLKDDKMAEWLVSNLRKGAITKLTNYDDLSNRERCIIFSMNQKKIELQFSLFNKQHSENISYIARITKDLWEKQDLKEKNVQYEDVTSKIKKASNFSEFTYIFELKKDSDCTNILKKIKFIKFGQVLNKLVAVDAKCQEKILKDSILNILKNKNQSLQFNSNEQKMKIMNKLVEENKNHNRTKWVGESLSHIQFVFAEQIKMEILPYWLRMCQKTQLLNLSDNKIQDISELEKMSEIKQLILKGNKLKQPDMRKFTNLERLNVSDNDLKGFELKMLPQSLLELDIGDNKLQKLNLQVMPPNLRKLDLFGNHLTTINLKQLPASLQNLDLSYNKIDKIDEMKDSSIKVLLLSNNNLTAFKISNMPNLRQFAISENALKDFGIKNCPSLVQLHIGGTTLTKLEIIDFPSLVELSIEQNQKIKSLTIKQLPVINIINMNSLILVAMDNLQIQNLNQDGVTIGGSKKLIEHLQQRFPNIQFDEEDKEDEKKYEQDDSDEEDA